ncbi:MAG: endonuclease/exonuclease/phosphatase family protein [Pseudomonadota bacterium]
MGTLVSCITWNVHRCRGNDGIVDPDRTVQVLEDEVWRPQTDALILTEADEEVPPHAGLLDIKRLEMSTGLRCVHTHTDHRWGERSHGFLGVIVFLQPRFAIERLDVLDLPGHCHRGAVIVDARSGTDNVRWIGTHLSLWQGLRMAQLRTIGQYLFRRAPMPTVLAGDLNEWRPWGGMALSARVMQHAFSGPAKGTFPINRPMLPLDRILASPDLAQVETEVLDGPGIRMTSDHRPIWGRVSWSDAD